MRVAIVAASDGRSAGRTEDAATPQLVQLVEHAGHEVVARELVPDDRERIAAVLVCLVDELGADLVLTTGGTGLGPRDVTPEATMDVSDRSVPGLAELMRARSAEKTPHAWLSRAVVGVRGASLVVNLPGSPRGAVECAGFVLDLVPHAVHVARGGGHS